MTVETFTNFRKSTDPTDRGGFGAEEIYALRVLNGSSVQDLAAILDGDEAAFDVTVTGAALGDFVMVSASIDVTDLQVSAQVSAADTVAVTVSNSTGATVDLGSATFKVKVIHDGL